MLIAVDRGQLPEANEGGRRPATGFATTTGSMLSVCWGTKTLTRIAEPPAPQRAVSASQAVRELGYGAQGNEVNRSLKSVWFAAPPSMGLTLKISSTVRSVELWS